MTVSGQRRLAYSLLAIGAVGLLFSFRYYHADRLLADLYIQQYGDKLDRTLKKAAGSDATPCSRTHVQKDSTLPESNCAQRANAQDNPFFASYEIQEGDGFAYRGLARSATGTYVEYTWAPGANANAVFSGPDPELATCIDARRVRHNWQGVLTCTNLH